MPQHERAVAVAVEVQRVGLRCIDVVDRESSRRDVEDVATADAPDVLAMPARMARTLDSSVQLDDTGSRIPDGEIE